MPVIGISVAVMALIQLATIVGAFIAVRIAMKRAREVEQRLDATIAEFKPQVAHILNEARAASAKANELLVDVRRHMETMEDTARTVRHRIDRAVGSVAGVASAAGSLPGRVKMTGPAAMAVWAGMRMARSVAARVRERRRERRIRQQRFEDAESYIGIG